MNLDSIQVHRSVTSTVKPDGAAAKEVSQTDPRWTCTDSRCQLGFAAWEDVVEHVGIYHRGPDDAPPSPQPQTVAVEEPVALAEAPAAK